MSESQNAAILKDLRDGLTLDPMLALNRHNCWALRSRICEIEGKSGHARMLTDNEVIVRTPTTNANGKRYMTYSLVTSKAAAEWDRMKAGA